MTKFIRDFRYPHPRVDGDGMDEVAEDMGPGGICEDCGHQALRHSRSECRYHELDPQKIDRCSCRGMLWRDTRYYMDPAHGVLYPANRGRLPAI